MNKKLPLLFFLFSMLCGTQLYAGGGPDAYGYVWLASTDAGGPAYNWIDITTTGTQVTGLADDNAVGPFPIGFSFHYYWNDYNQIKIGSNGWAAFDNVSNIAHCFPTIPTAGGVADNYLAPFMADLNFFGATNPGRVYTYTNSVDTFIISYEAAPFWVAAVPDFTGSNSFQIILSGADSSITFQYKDMEPTFTNNTGCASDNVVGIENSTGGTGLQIFQELMPPDTFAIKFYYPDSVLLSVPDLATNWVQNTGSLGEFVPTGLNPVRGNIRNVGNVDITTASTVDIDITNAAAVSIYSATATLPSLVQGDDSTFNFVSIPNFTTAGTYSSNVLVTNSTDINAGNNSVTSEIVALDLTSPTTTLTFSPGTASTGSLNWSGGAGNDGAGVHYIPPTYPMQIDSLEYFLVVGFPGDSMIAAIYDDNGVGGSPGTLLWSTSVQPGQLTSNAWNVIPVTSTVTISSGGFYVAWFQGGAGNSLGTETATPLSRRNYEILSGAWAEWRSNSAQELMIKAHASGYNCSPNASFSKSSSANFATFTNTTPGATSFAWDFGDGNTSTAANPTHGYSAAGTYLVCLVAGNICGNDTICDTITVTCPVPAAAFSQTSSGITYSFSNSSSGATTYLWDFGDGNTSTGANPTHSYSAPGTYTVCLTSTNLCGSDSSCQTITACFTPNANFFSSSSGSSVSFTNASSLASSVMWDFGDGNTSTLSSPTHTYASPGTYNACLIAMNTCGNDTFCQSIVVACTTPSAAFNFSLAGTAASFTDNSVAGTGSILLTTWDFGDGNSSSSTNPTHTYASAGSYLVCLTVTDSCGTDSVCHTVVVCPVPQPGFTFSTSGNQVTFTNTTAITGTANYFWDYGDGNTSTIMNTVHTYAANGTYNVCLTVSDNCGTDSSCQNVTIMVTGLNEGWGSQVDIWPNPADAALNIHAEGIPDGEIQISLHDLQGKSLLNRTTQSFNGSLQTQLDVQEIPAGIYLLWMESGSGKIARKVVVQ